MKYKLLLALCSVMLSTQVVFAEKEKAAHIFKCTNKQGDIFYNDKSCPKHDKETKIRAVKDPKGVVSPNLSVSVGGFVNGENDSSGFFKSIEEKNAVEAIDADIAKREKESKSAGKASKGDNYTKGKVKPAVTKKEIAEMTGSQRENYYEKVDIEQARLAQEGAALEKALNE